MSGSFIDYARLAQDIKHWGRDLGLRHIGISGTDLVRAERYLREWLSRGWHGEMDYMARHIEKRTQPALLIPGTQRVIMACLDYLPAHLHSQIQAQNNPTKARIAYYAQGRDYHRLFRRRLQRLVTRIEGVVGRFVYRVFVDSAPVMEKPLAEQSGLGWIGKHTNLIHPQAGSYFFLGAIFIDLPLPVDSPAKNHCGNCCACLKACPTGALIAPYQLDARRCIAYLTIEYQGDIPESLRPLMGNRIYGCDECQQVCPWNRFAPCTQEIDFLPRPHLAEAELANLFAWDEQTFLIHTEGSAIRRIGYYGWLRNLAIAMGNAPSTTAIITALKARAEHSNSLVATHTRWALAQHGF